MSTDQTTPPPASATLTGTAGTADAGLDEAGLDEAGLDEAGLGDPGTDGADVDSVGQDRVGQDGVSQDSVGTEERFGADGSVGPGGIAAEPVAAGPADHQPAVGPAGPTSVEPARQPTGSSWQAEASGRLVAMSFPGARRVAGWLFWVVFPLLCIAAIQTSVSNVADHLGKKPTGIRGTFVVQPRSCSQGFCSFGGLFTSDDHTIRNLPLLGDPRWHTADVHRVTYDPRSVEVTALPGHWDPTPSVMATFGALTYLVLLGYFVREQRRSGRPWRRLASSA
jgi:hypothetical protein